jgi:DNA-binding GntR family transcriptional regulator
MPRRTVSKGEQVAGSKPDAFDGTSLDRATPLSDQIYSIVRRAIVTGSLSPGAVIDDHEISSRLGLSRTPVREAVKKLSDEGLIDVRAQSGTYVAEIDRAQVEEAYVVRIALECESVSRAAPLMNDEHLKTLEGIIDRHKVALTRNRFDEAIARDDDFHRYIAQISGLAMLWKMVDTCKAQMDRCRMLTVPRPGHGTTTIDQHRAIAAALATKKPRAAIAALRAHLDTSRGNTLSWFDERDAAR